MQKGTEKELKVKCVNAHDLCHLMGPCPYCEPEIPRRGVDGRFAKMYFPETLVENPL